MGPSFAAAQTAPALPGRLELAAGVRWTGDATIGAVRATETTPNGGRFQLFTTDSSLGAAVGLESSVAVRLTRSLDAEASVTFGAPDLRTRVSGDAEGAPGFTATESMKELTVEGSLLLHLTRMRLGPQAIPYLSGGAGFLRDLHEGDTLGE